MMPRMNLSKFDIRRPLFVSLGIFLAHKAGSVYTADVSVSTSVIGVASLIAAMCVVIIGLCTLVAEMKVLPAGKIIPGKSLGRGALYVLAGAVIAGGIRYFWADGLFELLRFDTSRFDTGYGALVVLSIFFVAMGVYKITFLSFFGLFVSKNRHVDAR